MLFVPLFRTKIDEENRTKYSIYRKQFESRLEKDNAIFILDKSISRNFEIARHEA